MTEPTRGIAVNPLKGTPGALALTVFTDALHHDEALKPEWRVPERLHRDMVSALADLRALMEQRDNYLRQITEQADRAERAEAERDAAQERYKNECAGSWSRIAEANALRADVARLQGLLTSAGIALRYYAKDMDDTFKMGSPGGRREYPFGRDIERDIRAALAASEPKP